MREIGNERTMWQEKEGCSERKSRFDEKGGSTHETYTHTDRESRETDRQTD